MKKNPLEQRSYCFEVRADEETERGSRITGRPIVYEQKTDLVWFDEIISAGALDKTDLTDVRFLVNHDTSRIPLARSRRNNGNSTMQLSIDEAGMFIEVWLDTANNAEARALYSAVSRGDISGMSFMFAVREDEWSGLDTEHPTRRIKDISTVVEVSAVTFPAYESTQINARSNEALESARETLEKARENRDGNPLESGTASEEAKEIELLKEKIKLL